MNFIYCTKIDTYLQQIFMFLKIWNLDGQKCKFFAIGYFDNFIYTKLSNNRYLFESMLTIIINR